MENNVCANCGAALAEGQAFCSTCGTPRAAAPAEAPRAFCSHCGNELVAGQAFCSKCGAPVGAAPAAPAAPVEAPKKKKKKIGLIIVVLVIVAIIAIVVLGGGGKEDFNDMFGAYSGKAWCDIAGDGSWMKLDTNPNNLDDSFDRDAYNAVKSALTKLGFPSVVLEQMGETRSIDGRQSASSSDGSYTVSWTYHPDKGLEALFTYAD